MNVPSIDHNDQCGISPRARRLQSLQRYTTKLQVQFDLFYKCYNQLCANSASGQC